MADHADTRPGHAPPSCPSDPIGREDRSSIRVLSPAEAERRQRSAILRMVRFAFIILIVTVTLLNILDFGESVTPGLMFTLAAQWWIPLTASISLAVLFLAVDLLTPNKKLQTFGGIVFGLIAGLIVTVALGFVVDLIATSWDFAQNEAIVNSIKV
ncbi:MAG TPA: hypothetical protein ENK11_07375, partial [Phycisphaerales bacterium]|nr:hypothetical protein [Phycisphaerales bacterium]